MYHLHSSRLSRIAIVASGAMLLFGAAARAQTIRIFDDVPSVEQLRSIMVPEARASASRSIVIQRPDTGMQPSAVQQVSNQVQPAPRTPVSAEAAAPVQTVVNDAVQPPAASAQPSAEAKPGTVGFRINFAFNSAELPDSAHEMMDVVAQVMKGAPQIKVRIEGHTDAVGSVGYNVSLSERRALSVGEYLVKLGIDPSRLILVGKGMAEPLTANPYDPANRRVQFVRVG